MSKCGGEVGVKVRARVRITIFEALVRIRV